MGGLRYGLWRDFDVPETVTTGGFKLWEGQRFKTSFGVKLWKEQRFKKSFGFKLWEEQRFKA